MTGSPPLSGIVGQFNLFYTYLFIYDCSPPLSGIVGQFIFILYMTGSLPLSGIVRTVHCAKNFANIASISAKCA